MEAMTYEGCLQRLAALQRAGEFPKNLQSADSLLGQPSGALQTVLIEGSKGKSSVAAKIAACLQLKGLKVGVFVSPHLYTVRERILVDGNPITEEELVSIASVIFHLMEENNLVLTFHEVIFQIAVCHFAGKAVNWSLFERESGVRVDATRAIEKVKACVITSIGADINDAGDHEASNMKDSISEKALIMRAGCPVVFGPTVSMIQEFWWKADPLGCEVYEIRLDPRGETMDEENRRIAAEVVQRVLRQDMLQSQLMAGLSYCLALRMQRLTEQQMMNALMHRRMEEAEKDGGCFIQSIEAFRYPQLLPVAVYLDLADNEPTIEKVCREIGYLHHGVPIRICISMEKNRHIAMMEPIVNHFVFPLHGRLKGLHYIQSKHPNSKPASAVLDELKETAISDVSEILVEHIYAGFKESYGWLTHEEGVQKREIPASELSATCGTGG